MNFFNEEETTTEHVYTLDELAEKWGVTRRTILKLITDGELEAFSVTKRNYRVTQTMYDNFVMKNAIKKQ